MFNKILVCGAGAIGGTIAAFLRRAGHPVTVVDIVAEHVEKIRAEGLAITGPVAEFSVPCEAFLPCDLEGEFDLVLLAVKAQHTANALDVVEPHLASDGVLVSVQNGLNEPLIAGRLGPERTVGCFVHFGADYLEPGKIHYASRSVLMVGELDGRMSDRLGEILAILRDFEPDAGQTDNVFGFLWSKLAFGALLICQALSDRPTEEFLDSAEYRPMIRHIVGEVARVAAAEGVTLMPFQSFDAARFLAKDLAGMDAAIEDYANSRRGSQKLHSGVWRDLAVRRRKTEIAYWYAPVFEAARRHGVSTTALAAAVDLIRAVEEGERPLSGELLSELMSAATAAEGESLVRS